MVIYMYTCKQFHKMHAYVENDTDSFYNVRFISYNTLMLYMNEKDEMMCARDYKGTTTQKQVTCFLREFYGEKWVKAYKTAIKFYRRYNNLKDSVDLWFYIQRDVNGIFHFTFKSVKYNNCSIEFYQN